MKELRNTFLLIFLVAVLFAGIYRFFRHGKPENLPLQRPMDVTEMPDESLLVADGGGFYWNDSGSKILRIGKDGKVLWYYRGNLSDVHGAVALKNGQIMIVDSGKNRVLVTDRNKNHMWVSDSWAKGRGKLRDGTRLNYPTSAAELEYGRYLVSDSGNGRVLEINRGGKIFLAMNGLSKPGSVRKVSGNRYLVTETGADRVFIADESGTRVWQYTNGLSRPSDAFELSNGNILVTDTGHDRVLTVSREGKVLNEIRGMFSNPNRAVGLRSGNVLVCDSGHARLLEFDVSNRLVWEFRNISNTFLRENLTNGGAEILTKNGPAGWIECDLFARGDGAWKALTNAGHSGNSCLELATKRKPSGMLFWGQAVKALPGKNAELSSFVRNSLTAGVSGIGILFLDEWNGIIGSNQTLSGGLTNEWKEIALKAKVPENTAAVFVQLILDGEGSVRFDDVRLTFRD